jgi:4-amino-4-deoxy-L-arabinose transferase-like glycosyltransferase
MCGKSRVRTFIRSQKDTRCKNSKTQGPSKTKRLKIVGISVERDFVYDSTMMKKSIRKPNLYFIVLSTFLFFRFTLLYFIQNVTALAPDETLYLKVFLRLYESGFSLEDYLGWSIKNEYFLQILYLPAKILTILGIDGLNAIRLQSIIYSFSSILLLLHTRPNLIKSRRLLITLIIATSTPTFILWTTLGMRESFIVFFLSAICFAIIKYHEGQEKKYLAILFFCSYGLFFTKDYIFYLFLFSLLLVTIVNFQTWFKSEILFKRYLITLMVVLLSFLTSPSKVVDVAKTSISILHLSASPNSNPLINIGDIQVKGSSREGETLRNLLRSDGPTNIDGFLNWQRPLESFFQRVQIVGGENRSFDFAPANTKSFNSIFYGLIQFLFLPFFLFSNGSLFLDLQSFELPFWLMIYAGLFATLYKKTFAATNYRYIKQSLVVFCSLFTLASIFFETNLGTAVRHRSVLIAIFLTALVISTEKLSPKKEVSTT